MLIGVSPGFTQCAALWITTMFLYNKSVRFRFALGCFFQFYEIQYCIIMHVDVDSVNFCFTFISIDFVNYVNMFIVDHIENWSLPNMLSTMNKVVIIISIIVIIIIIIIVITFNILLTLRKERKE